MIDSEDIGKWATIDGVRYYIRRVNEEWNTVTAQLVSGAVVVLDIGAIRSVSVD
jgi:hypothetical protein